jgi:hypothetical protein
MAAGEQKKALELEEKSSGWSELLESFAAKRR